MPAPIKFLDLKIDPNAESIARFLGWMKGGSDGDQVSLRIRNALAVLEAAEALDAASVPRRPRPRSAGKPTLLSC